MSDDLPVPRDDVLTGNAYPEPDVPDWPDERTAHRGDGLLAISSLCRENEWIRSDTHRKLSETL